MGEEREYILGTDAEELQRLAAQHQTWTEQAYAIWARAGIRSGDRIVDLGCGPGFTTFDLAGLVGEAGHVVACDVSARFLEFLDHEARRLGHGNIETSLGPVEEIELPEGSFDAVYARWLFCWLPDPGTAIARVARCLRPGGALIIQDYLDWAAMKLVPFSPVHARAVAACMESWKQGGGHIDLADHVPEAATRCGLVVECFLPVPRLGRVGSLEWRWLDGFFHGYLPKLIERGLYKEAEFAQWRQEWKERTAAGTSYCYTPTMADIVLRN